VHQSGELRLFGVRTIPFHHDEDIIFHRDHMYPPGVRIWHPNGLSFTAYDVQNAALDRRIYLSVGGGFIVEDGEAADAPVMAVQASRIALNETEGHKVSLDQVIRIKYQTGLDMQSRYKETSLAGLALNIIEC
jgi:hypothetical protein